MDAMDWSILDELQSNARVSFAELGRRIGMSTPAVAERVRRLEDAGIIEGYTAVVHPEKAGFPIGAHIRVRVSGSESLAKRLVALAAETPQIVECHRCTGEESFALQVRVRSVEELEKLIDRLTPFGMTSTSLILSAPFRRKALRSV
ncbi:MAG: Lrp/AsnC family transcriptional regulator [Acidobacteria bacterium]|nr:Lrp/AsnC family transcriptional regulator [Acidobacteriota bacterium]